MNREWHAKHKMPAKPSEAQRLKWHLAHRRHCACRPMPDSLKRAAAALKRQLRTKNQGA